jgi:hypothetical protein
MVVFRDRFLRKLEQFRIANESPIDPSWRVTHQLKYEIAFRIAILDTDSSGASGRGTEFQSNSASCHSTLPQPAPYSGKQRKG